MFHSSSLGASSSFQRFHGETPNSQELIEEAHLLFHFPMQFYDDSSMNQGFLVQNQIVSENPNLGKKVDSFKRRNLGVVPRRRAGKKDRHSKICTAQGIRDRRMRLSLQVARKFFDLQDMLGYDKASKTIEWLFAKSKKAIKELTKNNNGDSKSESFVSDCEVVSEIEESSNKDVKLDCQTDLKKAKTRTKEKKKRVIKFSPDSSNPSDKLGFSNTDQDPNLRILPYGVDYTSLERQNEDSGTIEKLLGIPGSSIDHHFTPVSYTDPNTSSFMAYLGWDVFNHERAEQVSPIGNSGSIYR